MKRILSLLLALVLFMGSAVPAFAAESESAVTPRYTYIARMSAALEISSLGVANCGGSCYVPGADTVKFTCKLQRYEDSSWTTVKTWTDTDAPTCGLSKYYAVSSGYTYRVRTTCSVYNASGVLVESGTCYSHQVEY